MFLRDLVVTVPPICLQASHFRICHSRGGCASSVGSSKAEPSARVLVLRLIVGA